MAMINNKNMFVGILVTKLKLHRKKTKKDKNTSIKNNKNMSVRHISCFWKKKTEMTDSSSRKTVKKHTTKTRWACQNKKKRFRRQDKKKHNQNVFVGSLVTKKKKVRTCSDKKNTHTQRINTTKTTTRQAAAKSWRVKKKPRPAPWRKTSIT